LVQSVANLLVWRYRGGMRAHASFEDVPRLEDLELHADIAEQMLMHLEEWLATDPVTVSDERTWPRVEDLCTEASISDQTLARIRKVAKVGHGKMGGAARNHRYSPPEVKRMLEEARRGQYLSKRRYDGWEKWAR